MTHLHVRSALNLVRDLREPEAFPLVLKDLVRRLPTDPRNGVIQVELELLSSMWTDEELSAVRDAASNLEATVDIARLTVERAVNPESEGALRIHEGLEEIPTALGKVGAEGFASQVPRLLGQLSCSLEHELYDPLWIVGDSRSEPTIVELIQARDLSNEEVDNWLSLSNLIRVLGTCGTSASAPEILAYLRRCPRIPTDVCSEGIVPLLRRGVIAPADLATVARDADASPDGRISCLLALEEFAWSDTGETVSALAADPSNPLVQRYAVLLLARAGKNGARDTTRHIYSSTPHDTVRAAAARSLGYLRDIEFVGRLEHDLSNTYAKTEHAADYIVGLSAMGRDSSLPIILRCLDMNTSVGVHYTVLDSLDPYLSDDLVQVVIDDYLGRWFGSHTDAGDQSPPLRLLARADPRRLLARALEFYRVGVLAGSARRTLAHIIGWPEFSGSLFDHPDFLDLLKRLLSDADLTVRESAGTALSSFPVKLCERVFRALWEGESERSRARAVSTLAFWGEEEALVEYLLHEDLLVRKAANTALELRKRRAAANRAAESFASVTGTERFTKYCVIRDHGDEQAVRSLYSMEDVSVGLYRDKLIEALQKRLEDERERRGEAEGKLLEGTSITL